MTPRSLIVELPGLSVAALRWGPDDGPLALLLHGFPDTAWSWRHVGPALAADGWQVVAPFSRGYAPTGLPADGSYQVGALVQDVVALHGALGGDGRALLLGHDWGAITAAGVGAYAPGLFGSLVVASVPPLGTLQHAFRGPGGAGRAVRQLRNSWYIGANQLPAVPEAGFDALVRRLWSDWSPGYDAAEDLAHLARALPTRAHRSAALGYYRALAQPWRRSRAHADAQRAVRQVPQQPLLYLHGERDGCLLPELADGLEGRLAAGSRVQLIGGAGHFLQLEQPAAVLEHVRGFAAG